MIQQIQNEPWSLSLLAAQRQLYLEAKQLRNIAAWASVLPASIGLIVAIIWEDHLLVLAVAGGVLSVAGLLLIMAEKKKRRMAANVQEQFDTQVFRLPWNSIVVDSKIDAEQINSESHKFKGEKQNLVDWYPGIDAIPYPLDVLICQRSNLVWDYRQRLSYASKTIVALVLIATFITVIAAIKKFTIIDFALLFFPFLPAIISVCNTSLHHISVGNEQKRIKTSIERLWQDAINHTKDITVTDCRQVQDAIYHLRVEAIPLPDWIYRRKRNEYQMDMQSAANRLVDEYLASVRS